MKSLLLSLILLSLGTICKGQEHPNWSNNNGIVYRKVYESELSWKVIGDYFKQALKDITISDLDSTIIGECSFLDPTIANPNYKTMISPIFCATPLSIKVSVEYKRGKYRVTIRNIMMLDGQGPAAAALRYPPSHVSPFEKMVLTNSGDFKGIFIKQMPFYEFALDKFSIPPFDLKDEW